MNGTTPPPSQNSVFPMMHHLATSVTVLDCEVTEIRLLVERYAGVLLERSNESLCAMIAECLETHGMSSAGELIALLQPSPSECDGLLERLLAGESGFLRFPAAFHALERTVVPELAARKQVEGGSTLRIWSAGCGSGEEAYSIGMTVCEALRGRRDSCNIHIVGSDIRKSALETAERGLYRQTCLSNLPKHLVGSYFSRVGDHFLVKTRLQNIVTFAPMNLANPSFIGRFDCIFCMDVLPHFSAAQRTALVQRLHMFLEPGGYLFVGDQEKLPAADVTFTPESHFGYTAHRRPFAAAARTGK